MVSYFTVHQSQDYEDISYILEVFCFVFVIEIHDSYRIDICKWCEVGVKIIFPCECTINPSLLIKKMIISLLHISDTFLSHQVDWLYL